MAGSHLAEYLLTVPNVEVFGTYRRRSRMDNLEDLRLAGKLNLVADGGNVPDAKHVAAAIERVSRNRQAASVAMPIDSTPIDTATERYPVR